MDKFFGVLFVIVVGSPLIIITLAISWALRDERMDERQSDDDSDVRIYIPSWIWSRRSDHGHDKKNKGGRG